MQVKLPMTELKTRANLTFKLAFKNNECIERHIHLLKEEYGYKFPEVFKSITVDNGSEFSTLGELL